VNFKIFQERTPGLSLQREERDAKERDRIRRGGERGAAFNIDSWLSHCIRACI